MSIHQELRSKGRAVVTPARRARQLAIFAVALILLTSCGQEGGPGASPELAAPALLTTDDLPAGWTASQAPDPEEDGGTTDLCAQAPRARTEASSRATAAFVHAGGSDQLVHDVDVFASEAEAEEAFDEYRVAAAGCTEWEEVGEAGTLTYRLSELTLESLDGDPITLRVDIDIDIDFVSAGEEPVTAQGLAHQVIIRRSAAISLLAHFTSSLSGPAELDPAVTAEVASSADSKLQAAGYR